MVYSSRNLGNFSINFLDTCNIYNMRVFESNALSRSNSIKVRRILLSDVAPVHKHSLRDQDWMLAF
jgi:hypothetical protein